MNTTCTNCHTDLGKTKELNATETCGCCGHKNKIEKYEAESFIDSRKFNQKRKRFNW